MIVLIIYVIVVISSLILTIKADKKEHGEVTVGDLIFDIILSLTPGVNLLLLIWASAYLLGILDKKVL